MTPLTATRATPEMTLIDTTSAFEDAAIFREALLEFLKAPVAPPPAPPLGTIADVVGRIEDAMGRAGVALALAPGFVARALRAWLNRDIAMLVGAPGTGKSTFAREFGNACELAIPDQRETKVVLVDPDFDAARLLGYVDLAGRFRASEFTKEVLQTGQPLVPRVVIFEECNTAQLEAYAGQLLHAVESAGAVQLPDDSKPRLPLDVLLLATGNSVRDEPETRLPISRPSKRRMTIIEMPTSSTRHGETEHVRRSSSRQTYTSSMSAHDSISGARTPPCSMSCARRDWRRCGSSRTSMTTFGICSLTWSSICSRPTRAGAS